MGRPSAKGRETGNQLVSKMSTERNLRLEWRSPAELAENPRNWRTHPDTQLAALTDVIGEVGWAGACLYNERTERLIDGHARQKIALANGADKIPVLVGSWSEEEEAKILATLDPLAAMAEADEAKLKELLDSVHTQSEAINAMLEELVAEADKHDDVGTKDEAGSDVIPERFSVLVTCATEQQQTQLLERLTGEGFQCRSLIS